MTTIAIVGAGPGVGAAVARRFGREGFAVALIARRRDRLDALADELDYLRPVLETTPQQLSKAIEFSLYGSVAATQQVLPGMRTLGRGTIILVNGGSAVRPRADFAGTSIAFAAQSAYASTLHDAVAPDGIHVTQLIVPGAISPDDPTHGTTAIAARIWTLHTDRNGFRHFFTPMPTGT